MNGQTLGISTHVLDLVKGQPIRGIGVALEAQGLGGWRVVGKGQTDADGRAAGLLPASVQLQAGVYRLTFDSGGYYRAQKGATFYPEVTVVFTVHDPAQHYHIPLLLGPFGYTTYKGS